MFAWLTYYATAYALVPACAWAGAKVGCYIGTGLARSVWNASVERMRGLITITLNRSRVYIVVRGEVMEVDPRRKYIIVRGEVTELDSDRDIEYHLDDWAVI